MASPNRERFNPERSAVGIDRSGDMEVEVGVDPTGDQGPVLYDGHRHPFRLSEWMARHLPERRT